MRKIPYTPEFAAVCARLRSALAAWKRAGRPHASPEAEALAAARAAFDELVFAGRIFIPDNALAADTQVAA